MSSRAVLNEKPILEGNLFKKSKSGKRSWKQRYFRLFSTSLKYYRKKSDTVPRGQMDISAEHYVSDIKSKKETRANVFIVSDFLTTYHLAAENRELRDFWMHAIARNIRNLQKKEDWFGEAAINVERTEEEIQKDYLARLAAYKKSRGEPVGAQTSRVEEDAVIAQLAVDEARRQQDLARRRQEDAEREKEDDLVRELEKKRLEAESRLRAAEEAERNALAAVERAAELAQEADEHHKEQEEQKEKQRREEEERRRLSKQRRDKERRDKAAEAERREAERREAERREAERQAQEEQERAAAEAEEQRQREEAERQRKEAERQANPPPPRPAAPRSPAKPSFMNRLSKRVSMRNTPALARTLGRSGTAKASAQPQAPPPPPPQQQQQQQSPPPQRKPAPNKPAPSAAQEEQKEEAGISLESVASTATAAMSGIASRLMAWQNKLDEHKEKQESNVFSGAHKAGPKISKNDANYGKGNAPGSKSEARAQAASAWVDKQIDQLLDVIRQIGKTDSSGKTTVTFGELFIKYQDISDSLVGILMRAKKRRRIIYEGDMLFQGMNDHVVITLL